MPPVLTYIARVQDGLPLVGSFAPSQESLDEQKSQARDILRGLSVGTAAKMSIETGSKYIFHYVIHDNLCILTLTEQSYPKRLAFLYLEEVADGFIEHLVQQHGGDGWRRTVETAARPYAFIQFDPILQRKQRDFVDPSSRLNSDKLSRDLSDITSIMRQNIEQVLNRGEKLEHVSEISNNLVSESKKFKWGAKKLTFQAMVNQYGPIVAMGLFILVVVYIKFFM
jgi:vesicle transport protein SEC22